MYAVLLAVLATGLFAGAAVYITLVEHPARLACGPAVALAEFAPSYRRAAVMQASLALVGSGAAGLAWFGSGSGALLLAALLLGAVIPLTLIVILPTNARLLDPGLDPASGEAGDLLRRWGRLHALRSALGVGAFVAAIVPLVQAAT